MQRITFMLEVLGVFLAFMDTYYKPLTDKFNLNIQKTRNAYEDEVPIKDYKKIKSREKLEILVLGLAPMSMMIYLIYFFFELPILLLIIMGIFFTLSIISFYILLLGRFWSKFIPEITLDVLEKISKRNYLSFVGLVIAGIGLVLEGYSIWLYPL